MTDLPTRVETEPPSREMLRAKVVAAVLTENGMPVSSPGEGDLDDVERERWNACIEIVRRLDGWKAAPPPRYLPTDPVPEDFMAIEHEQYPLCPECGGETGLIAYPYKEGRAWKCDCGWEGERHGQAAALRARATEARDG